MVLGSLSNTAMEKALSALWQRQQTISHNIANEDTPGYKAKRLNFESILKSELNRADRADLSKTESMDLISRIRPVEYELDNIGGRADGNNVVIDNEYVEMQRLNIQYAALEQRINGHYSTLKYVISGGR